MITAEFEFTCTLMFILFFYSHLMGMFYRSIRMLENGIKPVYVFDGKPPDMKSGEVIQINHLHVHLRKIKLHVLLSSDEVE